jgi:TRAP-type mannitol/chloroaromatic compound transport system permease small subunit
VAGRFLRLERAAIRWARLLALLGGWLLTAVAVTTVADALLRKFLSLPIPGGFEATELLLAAIIFFALPYTGLTDGHVSVDLVTGRLSSRAQEAVIAVNALVSAVVMGALAYHMAVLALEYGRIGRTTITTRIPVLPFILPVAVAAVLSSLALVVHGLGAFGRALGAWLPASGESGR